MLLTMVSFCWCCFWFILSTRLFIMLSAHLTIAYQIANVLFEVLRAVNQTQAVEVDNDVNMNYVFHMIHMFLYVLGKP